MVTHLPRLNRAGGFRKYFILSERGKDSNSDVFSRNSKNILAKIGFNPLRAEPLPLAKAPSPPRPPIRCAFR